MLCCPKEQLEGNVTRRARASLELISDRVRAYQEIVTGLIAQSRDC